MKYDLTHIVKKAGSEMKLSEAEATHLDDVIRGYMAMKPRVKRGHSSTGNVFTYIFMQRGYVAAGLVIAVTFSGSISYAAEGTLPGDVLYGIKVGVNERLAISLTKDPESRAELEAHLAGKRLDEAARLAVEDRLTPEHEATLSENFARHAENASEETEKLHDSDESAAINVASSFESELESHESILASIKRNGESTRLTRVVREKVSKVSRFRAEAEGRAFNRVSISADAPVTMMMVAATPENERVEVVSESKNDDGSFNVARKMGDVAKKSLSNAKKLYENNLNSFDESEQVTIRDIFESAMRVIEEGDQSYSERHAMEAFHKYQSALSSTQSLLVYMKTSVAIRPQKLPNTRFRNSDWEPEQGDIRRIELENDIHDGSRDSNSTSSHGEGDIDGIEDSQSGKN